MPRSGSDLKLHQLLSSSHDEYRRDLKRLAHQHTNPALLTNSQERDQPSSSKPIDSGIGDPVEAENPLSKNTDGCVCIVDMSDPSKHAGSSSHVVPSCQKASSLPVKAVYIAAMVFVFPAFNPSNTPAHNHKQAQTAWTNSWCGVALTWWLFNSVAALYNSLCLRRTGRAIGLLLAICSLLGAVLGLVVLRFSTDEQRNRMEALLLVDLCIACVVSASMIGVGCTFLAAWLLDAACFSAEAICEDRSRLPLLCYVSTLHLVCSALVGGTVYVAIGKLEQVQ